jgi:universal stress protein A
MIEIRRILCPIDFSDFSRRALDHAIAIARWYESTVTALHVFSPAPVAAFGPGPVTFEPIVLTAADRDQLLADTKAFIEAEAAPGVAIGAVVREGNTTAEILDQASSMNADLIVMGTHGRSGFERLLLGSVAERVLRKARCPVLTVPRRLPDAVPSGPVVFKRIICALDFSACSMQALKYALSLAQEADGCLTVVHVLAPDFVGQVGIGEDTSASPPFSVRTKKKRGSFSRRPCQRAQGPTAGRIRCFSAASQGGRSCGSPLTVRPN